VADRPQLVEQAGDLGRVAETAWIKLIAGDNPVLAELVPRRLEEMRAEVLSPDADMLERMVVDQFCLCWLQSNYVAAFSAENSRTARQVKFLQAQQLKAQRRFQVALRSLAQLRRRRKILRGSAKRRDGDAGRC